MRRVGDALDMWTHAAADVQQKQDVHGQVFAGKVADRLRPAVLVGLRSGIVAARLQLVAAAPRWVVELGAWLLFHLPLLPRGLRRLREGLTTIGQSNASIPYEDLWIRR